MKTTLKFYLQSIGKDQVKFPVQKVVTGLSTLKLYSFLKLYTTYNTNCAVFILHYYFIRNRTSNTEIGRAKTG